MSDKGSNKSSNKSSSRSRGEESSGNDVDVEVEVEVDGSSDKGTYGPVTADITLMNSNSGVEIELIPENSNIVPRGICDPIMTLDQYSDDTLEMLDKVRKNQEQKHSKAPPLRFFDITQEGKPLYLDPKVESIRNKIWEYWYEQGLSTKKMVELLHIRNRDRSRHGRRRSLQEGYQRAA